jgi:hypothetical protein
MQHYAAADAEEAREQQVQQAVQRLLQQQQQGSRKRPLDLQPAAEPAGDVQRPRKQLRTSLQLQRSAVVAVVPGQHGGQLDTIVAAHSGAAVCEAAATAAEQGCQALASLALWQGLHVTDMAEQLMGMSSQQRLQLVQQYAHEMAA